LFEEEVSRLEDVVALAFGVGVEGGRLGGVVGCGFVGGGWWWLVVVVAWDGWDVKGWSGKVRMDGWRDGEREEVGKKSGEVDFS
jgi:hypothetical protein